MTNNNRSRSKSRQPTIADVRVEAVVGSVNFPDLLEGVPAAPLAQLRKSKNSRTSKVTSTRKNSHAPSSPTPTSATSAQNTNKSSSPAPSSPRSSKGSTYSVDFVDAVVLPTSPVTGKAGNSHERRSPRHQQHKKKEPGNETPSTNDSTWSNRSLSNHGKGGVPNLLLPVLSQGGKDAPSVMSSIGDEFAGGPAGGGDVVVVGGTTRLAAYSDDDDDDDGSLDAAALIRMAKTRVGWQSLQDENATLKEMIMKKDEELGQLHGQLRQAVATKCDLLIAHQEMEKVHELDIYQHEENIFRMRAANKYILEQYAHTERELLNELIRLNDDLKHLEKKRQEELDDWERLHKNEIFNKNAEIEALRDQLHQAGLVPSTVSKPVRKTPLGSMLFGL